MKNQDKTAAPNVSDRRGISQIVFVLAGMTIIMGGLYSLYMADAPYHPQDNVVVASE